MYASTSRAAPAPGPALVTYVPGRRSHPALSSNSTESSSPAPSLAPSRASGSHTNPRAVPTYTNLRDLYKHQPPTINVRQEWPHNELPQIRTEPEADLNTLNWGSQLSHIPTTGRMTGLDGTGQWMAHAWGIRAALLRLHHGQCVNNASLAALLSVIGQGLEGTAYMLTSFLSLPDSKHGLTWQNGPQTPTGSESHAPDMRLPGPTSELVNVNLPSQQATQEIMRGIKGRRVIASCVHVQASSHWVAVVYDIEMQALMVFDTIAHKRRDRFRSIALAWRQLLVNLELPDGFFAYCPAMGEQPNSWSCGFIAALNIHQCVRAISGHNVNRHIAQYGTEWIPVDQQPVRMPPDAFTSQIQLPFPLWKLGATDAAIGFQRAETLLSAIMCNEIGIRTSALLDRTLRPNARRNEAHRQAPPRLGFQFRKQTPWEPYGFILDDLRAWSFGNRYCLFNGNMYMPGGPVFIQGFDAHPTAQATGPSTIRALPRGFTGLTKRYTIRCWNTASQLYDAEALQNARRGGLVGDAISVISSSSAHTGARNRPISISSSRDGS
ncbi:hypothetical protein PWT90_08518 [Aphanocladium album]|nr:hypothetical protein PWT90_08518 [Aphanocladium album]